MGLHQDVLLDGRAIAKEKNELYCSPELHYTSIDGVRYISDSLCRS